MGMLACNVSHPFALETYHALLGMFHYFGVSLDANL